MWRNQPIGLNQDIAVRPRRPGSSMWGRTQTCLRCSLSATTKSMTMATAKPITWTDDTEPDPQNTPRCANQEDDDFDGLMDYPADPDCTSASARREDNPNCPGGIEVRRIGDDETRVEGELDPVSQFAGSCGGQGGRERVYALRISYPSQVTVNLDAAFDGIVYSLFDCSPDAQELGCAGNREDLVLDYEGPYRG